MGRAVTDSPFEERVIACVPSLPTDVLGAAMRALAVAGVRGVAVAVRSQAEVQRVASLSPPDPRTTFLGVTGVVDREIAAKVAQAGVRFFISPVRNREMISAAHAWGAQVMCSALTPQEAYDATLEGADAVRLFPPSVMRSDEVAAMLQELPVRRLFIPTSFDPSACEGPIRSGAQGVLLGGPPLDCASLQGGEYFAVTEAASACLSAVRKAVLATPFETDESV